MFPGMGGLNPKKMQGMMKQLGITQEEIDASKITIEQTNGTNLVINNPSITKMNIQGQDMFQVQGEVEEAQTSSPEDIQTIITKTGCTEEEAKAALDKTHDLADAIMELS